MNADNKQDCMPRIPQGLSLLAAGVVALALFAVCGCESSPEEARPNSAQPPPTVAGQQSRTWTEAAVEDSTLGEPARKNGAVNLLSANPALVVKGSPTATYDAAFVSAVKARWYQLLENRTRNAPGNVVVEFRIHSDGRVTNVKVIQSEVTEFLSAICQQAILDPAPYARWPTGMRRDVGADFRDVQFTFYFGVD
jgi:outer membrane biosynthesis protein TonB